MKAGINDGFLTPFKVHRIQTTLDTYFYTSDDDVIEGEVEEGRIYEEKDFNRTIEILLALPSGATVVESLGVF